MGVDRTTQKRRYSRLSDGYERLKSVLPTVKDKRRVSKVFWHVNFIEGRDLKNAHFTLTP